MKVISVKFKESGRGYYFDPKELEIKEGEYILENIVLVSCIPCGCCGVAAVVY